MGGTDKIEKWRGFVPDEELDAYVKGKFGNKIGVGSRPALLNIDTTYMFVDPAYSQCGGEMPELVAAIEEMTRVFRALELPIYYSRRDDRRHPVQRGIWNLKLGIADDFQYSRDPRADEWPPSYAPRPQDVVVHKNKPSCFFETPLESFLRYDGVDTLVVVGISTSGCVRAGVTDAFSHNLRVIVPKEAVGDRSPQAHRANLFDMDMKFADVEPMADVVAELERRFAARAVA
ncbi:isochorismatase family protein [Acuticoccus sp.]|uniref:isochorismatase family protein n=1 Tax=Acuticoccus sp. TaxID=1904378 RepID=UPI003B5201B1